MLSIEEAIEYINNFTWSESKLGLERTVKLLDSLGNPQKKLKFVHVAGSNGKGSTCAMIESVLRKAGYITGLYPSPYIEDFKESFQVCGEYITDNELCAITETVRDAADKMQEHPTQFEIKTAIAMLFYVEKKCDIVVLETGLGGELDSTNVIDPPVASVITNIGYEHTEYLGNTLTEIAKAKAGIIKPGSAVISYDNEDEVMSVLESTAADKGCPFYRTSDGDIMPIAHDISGHTFNWKSLEIKLPLLGRHQLKNAAVALKTIEILREKGYNITDADIKEGFAQVKWPARFEILGRDPLFILDGGHNEQCAQALCGILDDYLPDVKFDIIFGVLSDKDYSSMAELLGKYADRFICATPDSPRALPAERLAHIISQKGFQSEYKNSIREAVETALLGRRPVLAFGSLYMAGEVRKLYRYIKL